MKMAALQENRKQLFKKQQFSQNNRKQNFQQTTKKQFPKKTTAQAAKQQFPHFGAKGST